MAVDLRIVFLFLLFLTGVLFYLYPGPVNPIQMIIGTLLLFSAIGTAASFVFLLTRTDPLPIIRQGAYYMGLRQLVNFADAIPEELVNDLTVADVRRIDTDSDGFDEWIVFYRFDLQNGRSPVQAMVYDNDRGDPPVIFPYALRPPNRDYLGEGSASIEMTQVLDSEDIPQVMVWGAGRTSLNIFKFQDNSEVWDFPRDAPPRYQPIGFFKGDGGVRFDAGSKQVTVIDRNGFERSQLAIRSIYSLNPVTNTYLDSIDSTRLVAPVVSTIDFYERPPNDIFNTDFPEKVVLAFYLSNCGGSDETLCSRLDDTNWDAADFLTAEAFSEYQNGNAAYFGLNGFNISALSVTNLRYYPQLETDSDLLVTGQGRDVVTGEEPQFNVVDITFVANGNPLDTLRYEMRSVEGEWKIARRLEPSECPKILSFSPTGLGAEFSSANVFSIASNSRLQVGWETTDADRVVIKFADQAPIDLQATGILEYQTTESTTFELTASRFGCSDVAASFQIVTPVTITPPPPTITPTSPPSECGQPHDLPPLGCQPGQNW